MKASALADHPTREERFAARLSERRGLRLPVDVIGLARSLSDFEEKVFPVEIDGLCLDLGISRTRPKIWVEKRLQHHRKRFTVAHEIGHVIIPWHAGSIVDHLDLSGSDDTNLYFRMEGEANRFAAELLMPRQWVISLVTRAQHLQEVMRTITIAADVSPQAAAYRTLELGPPGYVVNVVEDGVILWSNKTTGTVTRLPRSGDEIASYEPPSLEPAELFPIGRRIYYWWKEIKSVSAPRDPSKPWRSILEEVVQDLPVEKQHKIKQRLNAITAIPFSHLPKGSSVNEMYLLYLKVIPEMKADDPDLQRALQHPRFEAYALARMHERAKS